MWGKGLCGGPLVMVLAVAAGLPGAAMAGEGEDSLPPGSVYEKPFLTRGGAAVGGYLDLEFKVSDDGSTFDQHRFVPFLYAEVSDRVHVASELEFEHGAEEISVEFATIDFTLSEALTFRGGIVLSPIGRLNVLHDAPMLDLTERPLVDRSIIPTTLGESGMGIVGIMYPSETLVVDYEAYVVNGFGADAVSPGGEFHLRDGRGSREQDNNRAKSVVARLGVSPRLGAEFGASVHTGAYDDDGERNLTLAAFDARYAAGAFELVGEGALARADYGGAGGGDGEAPKAPPAGTTKAAGFYLEGRWHFLAGSVKGLPMSTFTAAVRFDHVDMDIDAVGNDRQRVTVGVNFRPTEETVIKNDLLFDRERGVGVGTWSDTGTGYRLSLATYF